MVKTLTIGMGLLAAFSIGTAYAGEDVIIHQISGEACDARLEGDEVRTVENRALDKAGLAAVRMSGVIQEYYANLSEQALNLISYRIIDEYLFDEEHQKTLTDDEKVCVKMKAQLEITPDELVELINEYKYSVMPTQTQIAEVAEEVEKQTQFKPQNLNEKKLVYIEPLQFWNDMETEKYTADLREHLSHSEYFFVTDDRNMADFLLSPHVDEAKVDAIDKQNRKMKMIVMLNIEATHNTKIPALYEQQNHFILFSADKNEQNVADTLIRKLLLRGATSIATKLDKQIERQLEEDKLNRRPEPPKRVYF